MQIHLIRHAHAVEGKDDAARLLSKRGRKEIRIIGRFLRKRTGLGTREFWHSPLVRSRDTARLLGQELKIRAKLKQVNGLEHSDRPAVMARRLGKLRRPVAVVGHEPQLGALISLLVAGAAKPSLFILEKCSVTTLERTPGRRWSVCGQISPATIKRRRRRK